MTVRTSRRSSQHLLPTVKPNVDPPDAYDVYPTHPMEGTVGVGYEHLARELVGFDRVVLEGYAGVDWREVRSEVDRHARALGATTTWVDVATALKSPEEISELTEPALGHDAVFGKRFPGRLSDFFDTQRLRALAPDSKVALCILYGSGSALAGWDAPIVYFDVPKNEVSFRARAGSIGNLGLPPVGAKEMYRRSYFVDWPVLNDHKRALLPSITLFVDGQRPGEPTFASGDDVRRALEGLAHRSFRARPWFEPGAWGGRWIADRIPRLSTEVPNYAWSFELITPENGLILENDGRLLEVSFDALMFQNGPQVLGDAFARFRDEFPIRFDLLDTVGGGNLSVQCHPGRAYVQHHFGERLAQDETYYILDCEPGAKVYLGFTEDIDADAFRAELERSQREGVAIDVERYVQAHEVRKHDLYLIPNRTVHCSGAGNLVLEISATPYLFTFKMYDWLRMDLDGQPRPINIERAFDNLDFERRGDAVERELVSRPRTLDHGDGWSLEGLPTHVEHFYEVRRYTVDGEVAIETNGACHVMNVVDGSAVVLEHPGGHRTRYHYAETFVVPAAAGSYRLIRDGDRPVVIVQAMVKRAP